MSQDFKISIPPYHSASNRAAERAVQVCSEAGNAEDEKPVTTSTMTSKVSADIVYNTS